MLAEMRASAVQRRFAHVVAIGAIVAVTARCSAPDAPLTPDGEIPADTQPSTPVTVVSANAAQTAVVGDPFSYDATKGGTVFSDPRQTGLTYSVQFAPSANGFSATGGAISGVPVAIGTTTVTITARDTTGSSATHSFTITTLTNAPVSFLLNCGPATRDGGEPIVDNRSKQRAGHVFRSGWPGLPIPFLSLRQGLASSWSLTAPALQDRSYARPKNGDARDLERLWGSRPPPGVPKPNLNRLGRVPGANPPRSTAERG